MSLFLRSSVRAMKGYTPGEQPRAGGVIKLNTNENPYPPSPRVAEAIAALVHSDRLRKYPEPRGDAFRQAAGRVLGVDPESILIGNGSDDILTILTRAFVPEGGLIVSPTPSYLLYQTLADIQGAHFQGVPFDDDWTLPNPWPVGAAHLTLIANPNSPSGTRVTNQAIAELSAGLAGPVVVDEAYADFAEENALSLAQIPNVIVTRTLSKSYGLAGLRFGFAIARPELVHELNKVKDSYNCDVLSLAGAAAALEDQEYMRSCRAKILATRSRLTQELRQLGFGVLESHANFVWATRPGHAAKAIFEALKARNILVRYMDYGMYGDGLRISIGSDDEIDRLLAELRTLS